MGANKPGHAWTDPNLGCFYEAYQNEKCYLETFENMVAANKFYKKNGFIQLDKPLIETEHYACDMWYLRNI